MWCNFSIILVIFLYTVVVFGSERDLYLCSNNETIGVQIISRSKGGGCACQCQSGPVPDRLIREDYVHSPGIGSYKLHLEAKNWNEARKICNLENTHLAIINSRAEEAVLLDMLKGSRHLIKNALNTEEALLGIHDLYNEGEWVTIFGEPLESTGYSHWSSRLAGGQPDNFLGNQNCGSINIINAMDDVNCNDKFAFFCELPLGC